MSENQQPLTEEENTALPAEAPEAARAEPGDADLVLTPEEAVEELEQDEIDPADIKVFGMPRPCFHGAAFGVAAGYILCGLIGLMIDRFPAIQSVISKAPSATMLAVACAVIGYFIAKRRYDKRKAERDAEKCAAEAQDAPQH